MVAQAGGELNARALPTTRLFPDLNASGTFFIEHGARAGTALTARPSRFDAV